MLRSYAESNGGHVRPAAGWAAVGVVGCMYAPVLAELMSEWWTADTSSYGFALLAAALYLGWSRLSSVREAASQGNAAGLLLTCAGCVLYIVGQVSAGTYILRSSFVVVLAGVILSFLGERCMRILALSLLVLWASIPPPSFIVNSLTIHLQLLASRLSGEVLTLLRVPVYQDGNVLQLRGMSLGVAEACSGLHSLLALAAAALVIGLSLCRKWRSRILVIALSAPVSVMMNVVRITTTALIAARRPEFASGYFHMFSGSLIFVLETAVLILITKPLAHVVEQ